MKRKGGLLTLALIPVAVFAVYALRGARPRDAVSATTAALDNSTTFGPTIPNANSAPVPVPPGMVWIPGGEFSMGSAVESESLCSLPGITRDASTVHRVYVDGFWMDVTELAKEEFAAFFIASGCLSIAVR